jgi:hypothetical protein
MKLYNQIYLKKVKKLMLQHCRQERETFFKRYEPSIKGVNILTSCETIKFSG